MTTTFCGWTDRPTHTANPFASVLRTSPALTLALISLTLCPKALAEQTDQANLQLLVKPKAHLNEDAVQELFFNHKASQVGHIHQIGVRIIHVSAGAVDHVLAALSHNPNIEFVE